MPLVGYTRDTEAVSITWKLARSTPDVWRHLTSERHLPEWLGHARRGGFSTGDTLVVDHGDGYLCTSVVHTLDDDRTLGMTWDFPDEPPSRLLVTVEPVANEQDAEEQCLLHLRHTELDDLTGSYLPGWITHLTHFESSLDTAPLPTQAFWQLYETHHQLTATT